MLMELDDEEVRLIARSREEKYKAAELTAKRFFCEHTTRTYKGHIHNDDAYECTNCGDIEWR